MSEATASLKCRRNANNEPLLAKRSFIFDIQKKVAFMKRNECTSSVRDLGLGREVGATAECQRFKYHIGKASLCVYVKTE
jgi:hypothetical protein